MAKNSSVNLDITNNSDGYDISGGTTKRKLTINGSDITLTGSGTNIYTFPSSTDTLVGRDSTDTLTNKTLTTPTIGDLTNSNHTHIDITSGGTITSSSISDFDTEVSNNVNVAANTLARHSSVTVTDSTGINLTLDGQDIKATLIDGGIDELSLNSSINASLDLADSSMQDLSDDTTPQLGGNLDWNSNGITITGQTVGGSDGNAVYLSGSLTWAAADATEESTCSNAIGIRVSSSIVLTHGVYTTTGLTAGSIYYISETTGAITTTKPTTSTSIVRVFGYALSTTELFVNPDQTWVENA